MGYHHSWRCRVTVHTGSSAWADDKEGKITDLVEDAKVTIDQAIKTASEKVSGTVVEAELEKKHGKTVWEVEVLGADRKSRKSTSTQPLAP